MKTTSKPINNVFSLAPATRIIDVAKADELICSVENRVCKSLVAQQAQLSVQTRSLIARLTRMERLISDKQKMHSNKCSLQSVIEATAVDGLLAEWLVLAAQLEPEWDRVSKEMRKAANHAGVVYDLLKTANDLVQKMSRSRS